MYAFIFRTKDCIGEVVEVLLIQIIVSLVDQNQKMTNDQKIHPDQKINLKIKSLGHHLNRPKILE